MDTFVLYVLLTLPEVGELIGMLSGIATGILSLALVICGLGVGFATIERYEEEASSWKRHFKRTVQYLPWPIGGLILAAFIPNMKIILALVAWELGTGIDGIETLPANMVEYLNTLIEVELAEIKNAAETAAEEIGN